jgi:methyl-accepting chemotaxis protein
VTIGELSGRRATVYGIVAGVLGLVLIILQVTIAQVEGIDRNLGDVQGRIGASYLTLEKVVGKSAPTTGMADQVDQVVTDQTAIATTMQTLNGTLDEMERSTIAVGDTTEAMVATNRGVQRSIAAMSGDLGSLTTTIDSLVPVSRSTGGKLASMRTASAATRTSLESIVAKMLSYGLPQAAP